MKYRVEDFTIERYNDFLTDAKSRYVFSSFDNIPQNKPHILLRHDLDLSVAAGLQIATLEKELGISATYFVLLHSPFYNLLDAANRNMVNEIIGMGHSIGLHFDSHFYNITSEAELNEQILFEKGILSNIFSTDIKVFSFHLTNNFTMQCRDFRYGGLINAYADIFQTQYDYCSDSYGVWRHKRLFDFIKETKNDRLQILTHPEWWIHEPSMPADRIKNIIDRKVVELYADADQNYIYKEKPE